MPGLVPGIHVFVAVKADVDGRVKPGHDDGESTASLALVMTEGDCGSYA